MDTNKNIEVNNKDKEESKKEEKATIQALENFYKTFTFPGKHKPFEMLINKPEAHEQK